MNRTGRPHCFAVALSRRLRCNRTWSNAAAVADSDIEPPRRKHRTPTSLLEALSRDADTHPLAYHRFLDPFLKPDNLASYQLLGMARAKGRQSASYFMNKFPNDFANFNFEEPKVNALRPRISSTTVGEPSDAALNRLISVADVDGAWTMYSNLIEQDPTSVKSTTKLRLLDLMALTNGSPVNYLNLECLDIYFSDENDEDYRNPHRCYVQSHGKWNDGGRADELFKTLTEEELEPGYRAMIRGLVRHDSFERALALHREMRSKHLTGDLQSYNAVLRCVHTVKYAKRKVEGVVLTDWAWRAGLELMKEMKANNVTPDVETFNSLIHSLSFVAATGEVFPRTLGNCLISVFMEMEALGIHPNIGTFANTLRIVASVSDYPRRAKQERNFENESSKDKWDCSFEDRRRLYKCVDYILEYLNTVPGYKKFGTVYDMETAMLFRKVASRRGQGKRKFVADGHKLCLQSPSLFMSLRNYLSFHNSLIGMFIDFDPKLAIEIYENASSVNFRLIDSLTKSLLYQYCQLCPDRVDFILNRRMDDMVIFSLATNSDVGKFIGMASQYATTFPEARVGIIRSLRRMWSYCTHLLQPLEVPPAHFFLLLAICMPDEPQSQRFHSPEFENGVDLAWTIFQDAIDNSAPAAMSALHKFLQLGMNLLELDRVDDALQVLRKALAADRAVNKHCLKQSNFVVKRLLDNPKYCDSLSKVDPSLVAKLRRHVDETEPCFHFGKYRLSDKDITVVSRRVSFDGAYLKRESKRPQFTVTKLLPEGEQHLWKIEKVMKPIRNKLRHSKNVETNDENERSWSKDRSEKRGRRKVSSDLGAQ